MGPGIKSVMSGAGVNQHIGTSLIPVGSSLDVVLRKFEILISFLGLETVNSKTSLHQAL